jgi:basic membrane protein A and related proteins
MTRPRLRLFGVLLAFALVVAACGDDDAATTEATTAPEDPLRVALVLPGSANDKGFNQLAFEALALLESEFGAETAFSEMTPVTEFVKAYEDYASDGFDIVIGQGFEFGEIAVEVAPAFPDTIFLVTNNPAVSGPNMQGLQPASQDAAYLAGIAAGMASETGKIGAIAGFEYPVIVAQLEAWRLGALSVNPDLEVTLTYMGTFDDVEKGKETARAMASVGVDVIYHISDAAGIGVIQAADEEGILAIGWGGDQSDVAPNAVLTSQIVDQRILIVEAVRDIVNGEFSGEQAFFGLDSPVLGLVEIGAVDATLAAEIQAAVDAASAAILDGSVEVPFIPEPQN